MTKSEFNKLHVSVLGVSASINFMKELVKLGVLKP